MSGLFGFLLGKKDVAPPPPTHAPPPRYHIRLVLCQQSDSRPHVCLYDSLAPCRHKSLVVPSRVLDYPTPLMLGEMMFGTMPIRSQADGLKVYCIAKEDACKLVFIKPFCVDVVVDNAMRVHCKTQFAFAVVFSVLLDREARSADGAAPAEPAEVALLLSHFPVVEAQLGTLLQACRGAISTALVLAQPSGARQVEQLVRAKLAKASLQACPTIQAAARTFMETLFIFLHPHQLLPPFFAAPHAIGASPPTPSADVKAARFFDALTEVLESLDTSAAHFLVSSAVTALLTHHLTWVAGLVETLPGGPGPPADANAVWGAMVRSLYGLANPAGRFCKVVVVGPDGRLLDQLLEVLSYFVRCGSVSQRLDLPDEGSDPAHPPGVLTDFLGAPYLNGSRSVPWAPPEESAGNGHHAPTAGDDAQSVPFVRHRAEGLLGTYSQHCYSAHTSCLSVPFVIMRLPLAYPTTLHRPPTQDPKISFLLSKDYIPLLSPPGDTSSGVELLDEDLIALCREPVVCRSYDGKDDDLLGAPPPARCQCVVINAFSRLCYVATLEEPEGNGGGADSEPRPHVRRRLVSPSDFIYQTLQRLRSWKKHLHCKDAALLQYLEGQLYAIYQQAAVLCALVEAGCPEAASPARLGLLLGVSPTHVPLVAAVAEATRPSLRLPTPNPPGAAFTPASPMETLVDSLL